VVGWAVSLKAQRAPKKRKKLPKKQNNGNEEKNLKRLGVRRKERMDGKIREETSIPARNLKEHCKRVAQKKWYKRP